MKLQNQNSRPALTLLEVIVAMAIFLISLVAIWQLVLLGSDRALDVKLQARTSIVCQSKLAEAMIGPDPPIATNSYTNITDPGNEDLMYKTEVNEYPGVTGLYEVRVWVKADLSNGRMFESHLSQLVLDPTIRGSTQDPPILAQAGTPTQDPTTDPNAATNPSAGGGAMGGGGAAGGNATKGGGTARGAARRRVAAALQVAARAAVFKAAAAKAAAPRVAAKAAEFKAAAVPAKAAEFKAAAPRVVVLKAAAHKAAVPAAVVLRAAARRAAAPAAAVLRAAAPRRRRRPGSGRRPWRRSRRRRWRRSRRRGWRRGWQGRLIDALGSSQQSARVFAPGNGPRAGAGHGHLARAVHDAEHLHDQLPCWP